MILTWDYWTSINFSHFNRREGSFSDFIIDYYMLLSDLYCGDEADTFDDCSYNMTMVNFPNSELHYIILSCNPAPGNTLTVLYIKLKVVNKNYNCSCLKKRRDRLNG